jgi:hypothetical protein
MPEITLTMREIEKVQRWENEGSGMVWGGGDYIDINDLYALIGRKATAITKRKAKK